MSHQKNRFKLFIDRALSRSIWQQALTLVGLLLFLLLVSALLLLCSKGSWSDFCTRNHISPWLLPIYLLIDTNALNYIYTSGGCGWMLFACTVIYIFGLLVCSGMLIGVITNYIGDRVQKHRDGLLHYVKSGHYVIMGYDDMVPSIIAEIFTKAPDADVVLLTALDAKQVNEKLLRSVARNKMDQIFVTYGHRMVMDTYKDIHLEVAEEIYIVGNRTRPAHDAINVECMDNIQSYLKNKVLEHVPKRITCVFEDLDTYAAFKTTELFSQIGKMGIEFIPYNFYAGWAQQVFVRRSYQEKNRKEKLGYPSVYGNGIMPDDKKFVHLVFVGTSNFSVSFAMEAAHLLHFPNFSEKDKSPRTRITFIEKNADEELRQFATRNRHFFEVQPYYYADMTKENSVYVVEKKEEMVSQCMDCTDFLDVEFEFIKGDAYAFNIQTLIGAWAKDTNQYLALFLATNDQRGNFMLGMNMPDAVYDHAIPVFIRQDRADDFVTNLRETDAALCAKDGKAVKYYYVEDNELKDKERKGRYANIYPFGMDDMAFCDAERALRQAKLINYLYDTADYSSFRFKDTLILNAIPEDTIWADAETLWRKLSVAKRWSNLYCAYSIPCKLATLRAMRGMKPTDSSRDRDSLDYNEIEQLARVEHNRWNVEKLLMGFRKPEKKEDKYDDDNKLFANELKKNKDLFIHHDIRPFGDLDDVQKLDYEIAKYIPWILEMTELKMPSR